MAAAFSASRHTLWRLITVALLLPTLFVAIDRLLLDALAGLWLTEWTMLLTMAIFVIQIGLMGVVCARWIDWPLLRWLLYGWCWLLIDFQTLITWAFAGQYWWGDAFQASALLAAQLGLAIIWAVLGDARWTVRLPVTLVAAALLLLLLIRFRHWGENAALLFAVQGIALLAVCGCLRWRGYRLTRVPPEPHQPSAAPQPDPLSTNQFELRDVLIWTTALALVFGAIRAIGLPIEQWLETRYRPWLPLIVDGAAVAIVLVIALWAALGAGTARTRWAVVLVSAPAIGLACGFIECLVWIWRDRLWASRWGRGMSWPTWLYWAFWEPLYSRDRPMITSICLAGATLFATLLFLRSLGYRLERKETTAAHRAADVHR
jgi:hypothetical protein